MFEVLLGLVTGGIAIAAYISQKRSERLSPDWNGVNWLVMAPDGKVVTINSPAPPAPPPTNWEVDMQLQAMGYKP
jgi:hypothetical protein